MPPEDLNVEAAVEAFLAEDGGGGDDSSEPAPAPAAANPATAPAADDDDDAEGDDAETDGADTAADSEPVKPAAGEREPTPLEAAIAAKDVRAFLAALGDSAEELLGGKAHKALRHQAKELRVQEDTVRKSSLALKEEFGDPRAAGEAAKKGPEGADAFIDAIERQFGASWADCVKYVNDSQAGRDARLQAKAKAATETTAAADAKRGEHETTLKTLITDTVKTSDAKLFEADPEIVDDVFRIMQGGWKKGINTPAKALAALKARLAKIAGALAPTAPPATPARRRAPAQLPPPRVPQAKGPPPRDVDEMVEQFLREDGYHGR